MNKMMKLSQKPKCPRALKTSLFFFFSVIGHLCLCVRVSMCSCVYVYMHVPARSFDLVSAGALGGHKHMSDPWSCGHK